MSIVADRGLFVRLPVQSGRFDAPEAEAPVDALDAATKEPATKADLAAAADDLRSEVAGLRADVAGQTASLRTDLGGQAGSLRTDVALLPQRMDAMEKRLDARIAGVVDKLLVRLGGLMLAPAGAVIAALRLTQP